MTECRPAAAAFVVLAAGSGTRLGGGVNKVYLSLDGKPVIAWSLEWAARVPEIGRIVMVIRPEDERLAAQAIAAAGLDREVELVYGGVTRHGSEQAALDHLSWPIAAGTIDVVAIHDGARPLAGARLLREVIIAAAAHGGAVPAIPEDHAWRVDPDGTLQPGAKGMHMHRVQTPQAFRARPLFEAYATALKQGTEGTDTAATLEGRDDVTVVAIPGIPHNLKVTYAQDLVRAHELLRSKRL
jgi:2-C-methyl-D-erythritol 4-phosphate cytidylyltransferase